jgi:thiol-disulfide isomerase/thioredoxin
MKQTIKYFIGLGVMFFAAACTGYTEPEPVIGADKIQMIADGHDAVNFSVEFMGKTVTADAVIRNSKTGETLDGNIFVTKTPGTYSFIALYDGYESYLPVTVIAQEASLVLSTQSYNEEGSGENMTRTFVFKALYGTIDVSRDENLVVTDSESSERLEKNESGYYTVTTVGNEKKSIVGEWNGHTSLPFMAGPMRFYKRVGILEFTGTWCQYCSNMATYIGDIEPNYPDRNVMMAVHVNDELAIPYSNALVQRFKTATLPAAVLDFGEPISTTSTSDMENRIRTIVETNPAECGIAISTSVTGKTVSATVRLLSSKTMEYGMVVALTENGITGYPQVMPDKSVQNGYVHNHTLREIYQSNIEGVSMGEVVGGAQAERSFDFDLKNYNAENCSIVVFATSGTGIGLKLINAAECALGESVDFQYESDL